MRLRARGGEYSASVIMEIYRSIYKYQLKCFSSLTHFSLSCRGLNGRAAFLLWQYLGWMWRERFPPTSTEKVEIFQLNYRRRTQTYYRVLSAFPPYEGQLRCLFLQFKRHLRFIIWIHFHSVFMHISIYFWSFSALTPFILSFILTSVYPSCLFRMMKLPSVVLFISWEWLIVVFPYRLKEKRVIMFIP